MASLFNTKISNTYVGLIKTIDNAVISASLRELTDGSGNQTGVFLNNAGDFKVTNILEFGSLKDTGESITITKFVDEADGIANNDNDTSIPTSAAVKDFVTSQITLEDLDFSGDSGTGSVDLDSQVFAIVGTANEIETLAGSQQLQIGIPSNPVFTGVVTADGLDLGDDEKIRLGSGQDFEIYNDSSGNIIDSKVADLIIQNTHDDKDILFKSDDGSGGVTTYFFLDGSQKNIQSNVTFRILDTGKLQLGNGADLEIFHNGTNTAINNATGDLTISNFADDKDIIFQSDDGSGGVTTYFKLDGSGTRTLFSKNIRLEDDVQLNIGSSDDFRLVHSPDNSFIQNFVGDLQISNFADNKDILFRCDDNSGGLETYFFLDGGENRVTSNKEFRFIDNAKVKFGTSGDLEIYHDGSNSYIQDVATGNLIISGSNSIQLKSAGDEFYMIGNADGQVALYNNGIKKFETSSNGVEVTGVVVADGLDLGDNEKARFGDSQDLEIFHDGSHSRIKDVGAGHLVINATDFVINNSGDTQNMITAIDGSAVNLYFNGSKKLETTSTGVSVTGNIVGSGNLTLDNTGDGATSTITLGGDDLGNKNNSILFVENRSSGAMTFGFTLTNEGSSSNNFIIKNHNNSVSGTSALTIARDDGAITTGGNLTVAGDLTVNGTTTTVNTETLAVEDPLISMAKDNSANSVDIGFYGRYNDGSNRYLGLFSNASDNNKFVLFKGLTEEPTTTVNVSGTGFARGSLLLDSIGATGDITTSGNITLNSRITFDHGGDHYFEAGTDSLSYKSSLGSAVVTFNASTLNTSFGGDISLADSKTLNVGTGNDLQISHNGTDTQINNLTGNLQFTQLADDKDISFASDNGSGGDTIYMTIDGSATTTVFHKNTRHNDNVLVQVGAGNDAAFYHQGTDTFITNSTGHLKIRQFADDKDIIFDCDNGSGGVTEYFRLDGGNQSLNVSASLGMYFADGCALRLGNDSDITMFHDNSNGFISNTTGDLVIKCDSDDLKILAEDDIVLRDNDDSTNFIHCINGGSVKLYHNGSEKLETDSTGISITNTSGTQVRFFETDSSYTESMRLIRFNDEFGFHYGENANEEAFTIDKDGNSRVYHKLGIRVDGDAIDWRGTAQIPAVINLAGNGAVFTRPDVTFLSQNFYYNSSDVGAVIDSGQASLIQLTAGEIIFSGTTTGASSDATISIKERMRIDNAGDLKLGNSTRNDTRLVVTGANSGTNPAATGHMASALILNNGQATDNAFSGIDFNNGNALVDSRIVGIHTDQSGRKGALAFLTHNGTALTEQMRITDASVGIGTDSPHNDVGGLSIAVAGSTDQLYLERTGSGTGRYYLGTASNEFYIVDDVAASTRLKIDSSGNTTFAGDVIIDTIGKGILFDTNGANGSNFIKTINDFETVVACGRGAAGFAVIGNSDIRLGFGTNYTDAETALSIDSSDNATFSGTISTSRVTKKGGSQYNSTSTSTYTTILTFDTTTNNRAYSVLLSSSENNFSQMYRVSGSVAQNTCYTQELGDSGHTHSKDIEFRITEISGVKHLQFKNVSFTTNRIVNVYDVCVALGDVTFA